MIEEEKKLQDLRATMKQQENVIEQYKGALGYNQGLIDTVTKELEELNKAAFAGQARSATEEVKPQ